MSKSPYILLNKNINFNKNETPQMKTENPTNSFRETNLVFQLIYESQVKGKNLRSLSSCKKKKKFFLPFILSKGNVFDICVLSRCIVYWIHFQNIHTFTYQKTLLHTLFCLFFKIVENLQCNFKFVRYGISTILYSLHERKLVYAVQDVTTMTNWLTKCNIF